MLVLKILDVIFRAGESILDTQKDVFFGFWKYGDEFFISFVLFVVNFSFSYICQIIFLGESIFVKLLLVSTLEQRDVLFRFAANGSGINIQMLRRIADLSNY